MTWRVRRWIRATVVLAFLGLCAQQAAVVANGPASEVRDGVVFLAVYALLAWLLAFRPRVAVRGEDVEVRNPLRTTRFRRDDVVEWYFHGFGLAFALRDGRRPWSIVFQGTAVMSDRPRWADCVEAVTGVRPELPVYDDDQDEDDES